MDVRILRLLFVFGLISTALAKNNNCSGCNSEEVAAMVAAIGFTKAGPAKGSFASWMMSVASTANNGRVPSGGFVAILQSIGSGEKDALATAEGSTLATLCKRIKCG